MHVGLVCFLTTNGTPGTGFQLTPRMVNGSPFSSSWPPTMVMVGRVWRIAPTGTFSGYETVARTPVQEAAAAAKAAAATAASSHRRDTTSRQCMSSGVERAAAGGATARTCLGPGQPRLSVALSVGGGSCSSGLWALLLSSPGTSPRRPSAPGDTYAALLYSTSRRTIGRAHPYREGGIACGCRRWATPPHYRLLRRWQGRRARLTHPCRGARAVENRATMHSPTTTFSTGDTHRLPFLFDNSWHHRSNPSLPAGEGAPPRDNATANQRPLRRWQRRRARLTRPCGGALAVENRSTVYDRG